MGWGPEGEEGGEGGGGGRGKVEEEAGEGVYEGAPGDVEAFAGVDGAEEKVGGMGGYGGGGSWGSWCCWFGDVGRGLQGRYAIVNVASSSAEKGGSMVDKLATSLRAEAFPPQTAFALYQLFALGISSLPIAATQG